MSVAPRPWCSVVWEGYHEPENVVERDLYPEVTESANEDRDWRGSERSEVNVLLPERETHSLKTVRMTKPSQAKSWPAK